MTAGKKLPMTQEEKNKLLGAEEKLLCFMPHFRPLLMVMKEAGIQVTEDQENPTACTYPNGMMEIDREFLREHSENDLAFVMAHELGHHYLDTFGRQGRGTHDQNFLKRVNVASDTLINNMVNRYFMAAGLPDFSQGQSVHAHAMWWQPKRCYFQGRIVPGNILKKQRDAVSGNEDFMALFAELGEMPPPLEEACEKASIRWKDADEATMEYVLQTLTCLEEHPGRRQDRSLTGWAVSGEYRLEAPASAALPWPFVLDIPRTEGGNNNAVHFELDSALKGWGEEATGPVSAELKLHLRIRTGCPPMLEEYTLPLHLEVQRKQERQEEPDQSVNVLERDCSIIFREPRKAHAWGWTVKAPILRRKDNSLWAPITVSFAQRHDAVGGPSVGKTVGDWRTLEDLKKKHPELSNADIERMRKEIEKARSFAARNAEIPLAVDTEVRRSCYRVPWENLLQKWFDDVFLSRRDWNRASRRGEQADGICMPGRSRYGYILNVILDTSGSMDQEQLGSALGAIAQFCSQNNIDSIRLLECDDQLQAVRNLTPYDLQKYTAQGRGGTDMTPAMEKFAQDPEVTGVVILTDGEHVDYLQKLPPYHVLWGIVGGHCSTDFKYGTVMPIE